MVNIAICDDAIEELDGFSKQVTKYMKEFYSAFKLYNFTDGQDLVESMSSIKIVYDIVFLDIFMKFTNGINVAKEIRNYDKECKIIFITSSKEYAIESYEVNAFNYILKPITDEIIRDVLMKAIKDSEVENRKIVVKNKNGNYKISYKDILYAESRSRVVNIHLQSGDVISFYSKLEDFVEKLKDKRFYRCHKSFIVNMDYISKIENNKCTFMYNNITIPISNSNLSSMKKDYFDYIVK